LKRNAALISQSTDSHVSDIDEDALLADSDKGSGDSSIPLPKRSKDFNFIDPRDAEIFELRQQYSGHH
jgi:hypothetical protein